LNEHAGGRDANRLNQKKEHRMSKTAQDFVEHAKQHIQEIDVAEAKRLLGQHIRVLDVREPEEFATTHLPGAINLPRGVLEFRLADIEALRDLRAPVLVYCKTGGRCALAAHTLQQMGYAQVYSLAGGIDAWDAAEG